MESDQANLKLVEELSGLDLWLKIGLRSFVRGGFAFVKEVQKASSNAPIFLDLKFYDIPNTMADAIEAVADGGIAMTNIHASAGAKAFEAVRRRLETYKNPPIILGVTALTSFANDEFSAIYNAPLAETALKMAGEIYKHGLNGVVCSAHESRAIKEQTSSSFITLTPAIRPSGVDTADQARVATPEIARENLADFIVVGRPIYQSQNPREIASKIVELC